MTNLEKRPRIEEDDDDDVRDEESVKKPKPTEIERNTEMQGNQGLYRWSEETTQGG